MVFAGGGLKTQKNRLVDEPVEEVPVVVVIP